MINILSMIISSTIYIYYLYYSIPNIFIFNRELFIRVKRVKKKENKKKKGNN